MKKLLPALLAALLTLSPALVLAGPSTWTVDPSHSRAGFAVKHLVISTTRGEFTKLAGKLVLDEADVSRSSVEATIDAASIDTKVPDRDAHLRSADFLDAARYPTITFRSTKVTAAGEGKLKVAGDLTLHGVTRPVVLDVEASPEVKGMGGERRRGYAAVTRIDRRDHGLTWNKVVEAGPAVGDEITITLDLEVVKESAAKTASR
jgi:polyisoprenoid-binding protein YceI